MHGIKNSLEILSSFPEQAVAPVTYSALCDNLHSVTARLKSAAAQMPENPWQYSAENSDGFHQYSVRHIEMK